MKNIKIIGLLLLFLAAACSEEPATDCIADKLAEFDMVEYQGQEMSCKLFLTLFYYNEKQYFLLGNHCADMATCPFDCDGNELCESAEATDFNQNAVQLAIIGIGE